MFSVARYWRDFNNLVLYLQMRIVYNANNNKKEKQFTVKWLFGRFSQSFMGLTERNQVRLHKRHQMQAWGKLCEVLGIRWTVMINSNIGQTVMPNITTRMT